MKDTNKTTTSEEMVSIGEAAKILGVDKETLRRWDRQGKLKPDLRVGSRRDRRYRVRIVKNILINKN